MKFNVYTLAVGLAFVGSSAVAALSDENRPAYQKEFDAYVKDLEVIAQTGKAPENPILEADLAKMSSDQKILLTASRQKDADAPLQLAQNDGAKIVNSVEIIRVPEEFRKEYADVYKEEKTISAQSLVESQRVNQQAMINHEPDKITNHLNPFRFLKEVSLSPDPASKKKEAAQTQSLDPMVEAYFR